VFRAQRLEVRLLVRLASAGWQIGHTMKKMGTLKTFPMVLGRGYPMESEGEGCKSENTRRKRRGGERQGAGRGA
jgi:hypothetical protein